MCYEHLRGHPNIISMLAYGWRHERHAILPYIIVDYSPHGTLRDYLTNEKSVKTYRKRRLVMDVGKGLEALHSCGAVHGDLKLENVLVFNRSGDPQAGRIAKICDFGHSLLLSNYEEELKYRGTALYNAPEVRNQRQAPIPRNMLRKCDIWAFGLLAWEVLLDGEIYSNRIHNDYEIYDRTQLSGESHAKQVLSTALGSAREVPDEIPALYFRGVFLMTLQSKPQARTAFLSSNRPAARPHLDMGKSDWSFDMFRPERQK
ncbi:kinase-like protein [Mytilinidion resinicola]|uniref:Kinase-like protein n=1 Tax=Mytilinidion resinicola TaxID=574789 RepID=A0A6A6YWT4_9PEZI|nr:kinase-like protein [Mytilinidion resinicola]KAF2813271.1 kinase-like protein [Mytilinidion resinicola]